MQSSVVSAQLLISQAKQSRTKGVAWLSCFRPLIWWLGSYWLRTSSMKRLHLFAKTYWWISIRWTKKEIPNTFHWNFYCNYMGSLLLPSFDSPQPTLPSQHKNHKCFTILNWECRPLKSWDNSILSCLGSTCNRAGGCCPPEESRRQLNFSTNQCSSSNQSRLKNTRSFVNTMNS